ncbi:MAG: DMT family transporter [Chloroflexi bacterium]|nr:MAG: DMT family transporter [Chloroflexota bacterium]MBL1194534.1 DMT family transporter [Chloroflexota bacterium]NOH11822.1 DMT family transporter [Chloroflexota bacterium]
MKSDNSKLFPYIALGIGVVALGLSPVFVSWANAPGAVTSFYRTLVAVVILAWPFARRLRARGRLARHGIWMAVLGGLFFAADLAAWTSGVNLAGATNPTLLANTAPLWVGLGALIFFREKLNMFFWAGLILAMAGAVLILGLDTQESVEFGLGSLFGLISGLFYGAYFLFTQRGRETLDSLSYFWLSAVVSMIALLVLALVVGNPLTGYPAFTYWNFLLMGVVSQAMGYLAISYALGHLPASIVSPTLLGQPVVAALLAGPLLGERLTPPEIAGGVVVILGVLVIHRSRQQPKNASHKLQVSES